MMQSSLFAVIFWLFLLPALWNSGSLAGLRLREQNLFGGILVLGLGLICYAHFLMFAGLFHLFKHQVIVIFIVGTILLGGKKLSQSIAWIKSIFSFARSQDGVFGALCKWSLAAMLLFTALLCFLPEISNDALAIQLYLAKVFVRNASFAPSYFDIASYRPLFMSVLYASGMVFENAAIAKLFHWFCGLLLLLALVIKIEESTHSKKTAFFFGLMLWLTPTLLNQITATYIDAGVSLFIFLGYCMTIGRMKDLKPADFFYGGLFIGAAVAVRYLALGACFAILFMLALRLFVRAERSRAFIAGVVFGLGVLAASGFWFIRAWIFTGNPIYPYFGSLFGTEDYSLFSTIYLQMGLPRSIRTFLTLPFDITLKPQYFDYHHWIGPFYLLVLPFAVYAAVKIKDARRHLLFTFLLVIFWYFTGQNVRYLLPVFPVYLMAAAMGVNSLGVLFERRIVIQSGFKIVAIFLTASLLSLSAYHFRYQFFPVLKIWSREAYLEKMERTVPVAHWINENLPVDAKVLILEEPRLYYFNRAVVLDYDFDVRTKYKSGKSSVQMVEIFKDQGISHILDAVPLNAGASTARPIDLILTDARLVKQEAVIESKNIAGERYLYTLYSVN